MPKKSLTDWYHITLEARSILDERLGIVSNVAPCEDNGNRFKKQRYDLYWFYLCTDVDNAKNILHTGTLDEIHAFLKGVKFTQTQGVKP